MGGLLWALTVSMAHAGGESTIDVDEVLREELHRAEKYVETVDGCSLGHGYICQQISHQDFKSIEVQDAMLSGNQLRAWNVAFDYFLNLQELTAEQKKLKHYKIGVLEGDENYIVRFQGLLLPSIDKNGNRQGLMRASIGASLEINVSKSQFSVQSVRWDR